ncbi:MAG: permease-like cell division protein FtsX [Lachnospiraceae bacterium]|nr:permease-like cell division protein FtsX [Lachnospiraceae bacterium]MEE0863097.1 permease-like cell division protein FtsX [Lachnospiraceae bacterium]
MKIRTFFYSLKQGFVNLKRNRLFTLASVGTITACIFLIGLFYAVLTNIQHIVKSAEANVSIEIFFEEEATDEQIADIGEKIKKRAEFGTIRYISPEEAWENYKQQYFADAPELAEGFADDNPLADSDSYKVTLNDVSMQEVFVDFVEGLEGVRKVNYSESTANTLTDFGKMVGFISASIIIILLAVGIFLISNTIMIGIAVRKEEIAIMKLMGAKDAFVRAPFLVEGVVIGLLGAIVPLGALYFVYKKVIVYILEQFRGIESVVSLLPITEVFGVLVPAALIIGGGIGVIGSYITIRKHLRV